MGTLKAGEPGNLFLHTSGGNVLAVQLVFAKIYLQAYCLLGHHYQVTLGGLLPLLFCQCVQHVSGDVVVVPSQLIQIGGVRGTQHVQDLRQCETQV